MAMQLTRLRLAPNELDHELIWLTVSLGSLALAAGWFALRLPWPHCMFLAVTARPCLTAGATRLTIALGFAYRTPMSARQIAQPEISNPRPHQLFHFVTDRIKHAPDLLINSLAQNNAHSGRTDRTELCNLGAPTIQENSAQKFLRERAVPLPI